MKKLKLLLVSLFTLLSLGGLAIPIKVAAVDVLGPACNNLNAQQTPTVCYDNQPNGPNPLFGSNGVVTKAVQIFALIIGVTAVVMLIIYGIRFMVSQGDPNSVATARRAIIFAIIGILIAMSAQLFVTFVLSKV